MADSDWFRSKNARSLQLWGRQTLSLVSLPQDFTGDITVKFQFHHGDLKQARVKEAEFPVVIAKVNQQFFEEMKKT